MATRIGPRCLARPNHRGILGKPSPPRQHLPLMASRWPATLPAGLPTTQCRPPDAGWEGASALLGPISPPNLPPLPLTVRKTYPSANGNLPLPSGQRSKTRRRQRGREGHTQSAPRLSSGPPFPSAPHPWALQPHSATAGRSPHLSLTPDTQRLTAGPANPPSPENNVAVFNKLTALMKSDRMWLNIGQYFGKGKET